MINQSYVNNFQPRYNYNYQSKPYQRSNYPDRVSFGKSPANFNRTKQIIERTLRNIEFAGRKLVNAVTGLFHKKQTEAIHKELAGVDEKSPEHIYNLLKIGRFFGKNKEVEINLESGRIEKLAKSNEACIFIMNHDNQLHDPEMLGIFNTFLNSEYVKEGKAATCPRPRIILNEDILLSMKPKMREVFEKFGAIGVDASIYASNDSKSKNARKLLPTIKDFINNSAHIFIFPEGKNAGLKKRSLEEKFQTGIAEIIQRATGKKDHVKVVPLGFAYNTKSKPFLSSIHVGEPVYFKKEGETILTSKGNIDSEFAPTGYTDFFKKGVNEDGFKIITSGGIPVTGKEVSDYIGGVLCDNLKICTDEAKKALPESSLGEKVLEL